MPRILSVLALVALAAVPSLAATATFYSDSNCANAKSNATFVALTAANTNSSCLIMDTNASGFLQCSDLSATGVASVQIDQASTNCANVGQTQQFATATSCQTVDSTTWVKVNCFSGSNVVSSSGANGNGTTTSTGTNGGNSTTTSSGAAAASSSAQNGNESTGSTGGASTVAASALLVAALAVAARA